MSRGLSPGRFRHPLNAYTEQKLAQRKSEHLSSVLQAIRNVNQLITQEKDRDALLQKSCESLVHARDYYNAWIALLDEKENLDNFYHAGLGDNAESIKAHIESGHPLYCLDAVVQGQSMLVGVVLKDAQDRYIHWNKKASEVFGIGIDELKRMTLLTISRGVPAREV